MSRPTTDEQWRWLWSVEHRLPWRLRVEVRLRWVLDRWLVFLIWLDERTLLRARKGRGEGAKGPSGG